MYKHADPKLWNGRIDDATDEKSFRFHQMVHFKSVDDLPQDKNSFILIGFASDEGVRRNKGRTGASKAPNEIKQMLAKLPYNIGEKETIDAGNIICEGKKLEEAQAELGKSITSIFRSGNTPIILGGGHETLYGHYLGVRDFLGTDKSLGMINIDAHFDMRNEDEPSSGTMFKQILDQDKNAGYLCLGIQEFGNTRSLFDTAEAYGCKYILEENITENQFQQTFEAIDNFAQEHDAILLTLCTDSIIATEAPGVSAPSPFGLESKTVRTLLRYISSKKNITSFDISEVNPTYDEQEKTTRLAAILVAEVMKHMG